MALCGGPGCGQGCSQSCKGGALPRFQLPPISIPPPPNQASPGRARKRCRVGRRCFAGVAPEARTGSASSGCPDGLFCRPAVIAFLGLGYRHHRDQSRPGTLLTQRRCIAFTALPCYARAFHRWGSRGAASEDGGSLPSLSVCSLGDRQHTRLQQNCVQSGKHSLPGTSNTLLCLGLGPQSTSAGREGGPF